jgi:DNA-binding CsgD family transcriptional regulator
VFINKSNRTTRYFRKLIFVLDMNTLKNDNKFSVEEKIAQKIAEIQKYEDDIPGVIILLNAINGAVHYMSKRGREEMGVTNEELVAMGSDYNLRYFNVEESKEYAPKILDFLSRQNQTEVISLFQQVRKSPELPYRWHITGLKIVLKNKEGVPVLLMAIAIAIDPMHELAHKAQRILDENKFLKSNYHLFDKLTKREIEILKLIAKGTTNEIISQKLFISEETVETHRKNIKRKLNCKTTIDCSRFAAAFDLI